MINEVKLAYSATGTIQVQLIYIKISEIKTVNNGTDWTMWRPCLCLPGIKFSDEKRKEKTQSKILI